MRVASIFFGIIFLGVLTYSIYAALEIRDDIQLVSKEAKTEREKVSPYNHLKQEDIHLYTDRVELSIKESSVTAIAKTHSMDPLIDNETHIIQIKPKSAEDVHIGDIVSYRSNYADGVIIHRVINTGEDEQGWYAEIKGDNNLLRDPGLVRFSQIENVGVIIVY